MYFHPKSDYLAWERRYRRARRRLLCMKWVAAAMVVALSAGLVCLHVV